MLKNIKIKNFVIIEEVEIKFNKGLTLFTGETGAGKSIVIDAFGLSLGQRADTTMIGNNGNSSIIEADFDYLPKNKEISAVVDKYELPIDYNNINIRREVFKTGKSRAFINDALIPISALKIIGNNLVEMHGQHDNQRILNPKNHLEYLDNYLPNEKISEEYSKKFKKFNGDYKEYINLIKNRESFLQALELKIFHFNELKKINPEKGELEKFEKELNILENSQKLVELSNKIATTIYENDDSISGKIHDLHNDLKTINSIDNKNESLLREMDSVMISISEIGQTMASYRDTIPHDSERFEWLQDRVGRINYLMRKYNRSYDELCEYYALLKGELNEGNDFDSRLKIAKKELELSRNKLKDIAIKLHEQRKRTAIKFSKSIVEKLHKLGMKDSDFKVEFTNKLASDEKYIIFKNEKVIPKSNGIDETEFQIITNVGESYKPLVKVASGGEISRIMLAIKTVLAGADSIGTLIFDEIDSGVSGKVGRIVGEQIKALEKFHQVLCITHLPQIASLGKNHIRVDKRVEGKRTLTYIKILNKDERINEIASLLSGKNITDITIKNAKEFLGK
ncbi:MAG: DNA repair protein RecN, partial [Candidatus Marinimicrobia bacterium]|nr:DNA repair protein RecN [Candidatus Neomarinimicrobiota bacterium]